MSLLYPVTLMDRRAFLLGRALTLALTEILLFSPGAFFPLAGPTLASLPVVPQPPPCPGSPANHHSADGFSLLNTCICLP